MVEVECKAGQFVSRETVLAIVYRLSEDGHRSVICVEVTVSGRLRDLRMAEFS